MSHTVTNEPKNKPKDEVVKRESPTGDKLIKDEPTTPSRSGGMSGEGEPGATGGMRGEG